MTDKNNPVLAIIVPCYNEENAVEHCASELLNTLKFLCDENRISNESYICFVDDGSSDKTWEKLCDLSQNNPKIKAIKFAFNAGQQKAFYCGMTENDADIYITLDCDLQDDISVIPQMIDKYKQNDIEIVYTVRNNRDVDSVFKKLCADLFYESYSLFGIKALKGSADFRLVSRKVVDVLKEFKENNIYLRGLIFNLGFKYDIVYFERKLRTEGESKYTFSKQLKLAVDGITSLSYSPIKFISVLALLVILCGIIKGSDLFVIGGINLFAIGVIGEYIARISSDTRNRPRYIVAERKN